MELYIILVDHDSKFYKSLTWLFYQRLFICFVYNK